MATSIGDLVATLGVNNRPFKAGLSGAQGMLTTFETKATATIGRVAGMFGIAFGGVAVVAGLKRSITAASDLEEVMNKFNVVFGKNAAAMKQWGDSFAGQMGRSRRQVAEFLAGAQDLFIPLGFDVGAATEMSKRITGLALDLASFNNMADADVMRDLQAALTGSGEVMKKYGVIVSEAAVKSELMAMGMSKGQAAAASDVAKVYARLNIILRGTTAAQGDVERSSGSYANTVKALYGELENLGAAIGSQLTPSLTTLMQAAISTMPVVGDVVHAVALAFHTAYVGIANWIDIFKAAVGSTDEGIAAFKRIAERTKELQAAFVAKTPSEEMNKLRKSIDDAAGAGKGFDVMADALGNVSKEAEKAAKSVAGIRQKALDKVVGAKTDVEFFGMPDWYKEANEMLASGVDLPIVKAFIAAKKELDKLEAGAKDNEIGKRIIEDTRTPLETLKKEIADLNRLRSVGALGEGYASGVTWSRAVKAAQDKYAAAVKKKKAEPIDWELPTVMERGSSEAWKKIIGAMYASNRDKAAEETAKATRDSADTLHRIEAYQGAEVEI